MWRKPAFIATTIVLLVSMAVAIPVLFAAHAAKADAPTYDITTLAGKVASLNGTAGLQIRFSPLSSKRQRRAFQGPLPVHPPLTLHLCCRARWMAPAFWPPV